MDKVGRNPYRSVANADAVHLLCEFADRWAGWKYLGVTRSDRQAQAILMFLAVFEPLLTYKVLIAEGTNLTPWVQIACYCAGQAAVWVTIVWGPEISGYFMQRRWDKKVLSGEKKFPSRKEFLEERERRRAQRYKK